jgi:ubiquinone/menaquinone biosynthesis C-methylase UbiE
VGKNVLDLGCATGIYSQIMSQTHQVISLDQDEFLLKQAFKRQSISHYLQASVVNLPLKSQSIDTTVAFDILEHVDDDKTIKEIKRVTRKRLLICVPHTTSPKLSNHFLLYGHHIDTTHQRTYTPQSLKQTLLKAKITPKLIIPSHPIKAQDLLSQLVIGNPTALKIWKKATLILFKPEIFYTNLLAVADL